MHLYNIATTAAVFIATRFRLWLLAWHAGISAGSVKWSALAFKPGGLRYALAVLALGCYFSVLRYAAAAARSAFLKNILYMYLGSTTKVYLPGYYR